MKHGHAEGHKGEYGGGLVEFCFVMPVLLLIAGATVDLSRYMRYLQVTTFVSQETASQIYRQCSDITIYDRPELGTTRLRINPGDTKDAVESCVKRVQASAQQLLDTSLGRASVSSKVFRWNIDIPSVSDCTQVTTMGTNVTEITAPARVCEEDADEEDGSPENPNRVSGGNPSSSNNNGKEQGKKKRHKGGDIGESVLESLEKTGVEKRDDGIYQTSNGSFKGHRRLATPSVLCQKGRIATVEVGYAFQPTLLFLMTGLDTNGTQRETTVL
jgi:Flp pilus assembly protein TadG